MTFEHFSFRPYAPPLTCLAMYRTHVAVSLYVWEKKNQPRAPLACLEALKCIACINPT